jgi:conjugal transfer mating pair stabilization protein TraN
VLVAHYWPIKGVEEAFAALDEAGEIGGVSPGNGKGVQDFHRGVPSGGERDGEVGRRGGTLQAKLAAQPVCEPVRLQTVPDRGEPVWLLVALRHGAIGHLASFVPTPDLYHDRNIGRGDFKTGTLYLKKEGTSSVTVARNEGTCPALAADTTCVPQAAEVCTEGPETRIVDGVPVTQACWAWSRSFTCQRLTPASDCSALDDNKLCKFLRDECLDDPQSGACKVSQRVYSCPLPDDKAPSDKQYVCGGDVYCLNGSCETIEREASTEFKNALVALHSIGDAGKQFDPNNLTVFSGERDTCNKKIFGASNCCSGKGILMLTPWLCSSAEKKLDEKDDKGLCHKVGSYCSDKVLGICVTSKDAYCCFGSKLSRILQEQGRQQIGKAWAKPKDETCKGFTIEEFQRLDLSQMDFSEVYAEFMDAAKLPSEVSVMADIQTKIQGYYDLHGSK